MRSQQARWYCMFFCWLLSSPDKNRTVQPLVSWQIARHVYTKYPLATKRKTQKCWSIKTKAKNEIRIARRLFCGRTIGRHISRSSYLINIITIKKEIINKMMKKKVSLEKFRILAACVSHKFTTLILIKVNTRLSRSFRSICCVADWSEISLSAGCYSNHMRKFNFVAKW